MPKFVLTDAFVEIDGVDLTDHVSSVTVSLISEELDVTTYADDGTRRAAGKGDDSFELAVYSDYDAGSVDEVLYPLHAAGSDFLVRVRASSGVVSPANPEWTGAVIILEYAPLAGESGDLSQTTVRLPVQGTRIERVTE